MDLTISPELSLISVLLLGFVLGLKHAVEADHLAAVSTIVADRKNILSSTIIGGFWGVGHTMTLLVVGALVVFLKLRISESLEANLEALVGAMLVVLGLQAIIKLGRKEKIHVHTHAHDGHEHVHIHTHEKKESGRTHHLMRFSPRSILIGMVHGLAGSAAVMVLILPAIDSGTLAMFFIFVFGAGSVGGMMLMSLLMGLPVHFTAGKYQTMNKIVLGLAGGFSLTFGVLIVYDKLLA